MSFLIRPCLLLMVLTIAGVEYCSSLSLTKLLKYKYEMNSAIYAIRSNVDQVKGLQKFIDALKNMRKPAEKFFKCPVLEGESELKILKDTTRSHYYKPTFRSSRLKKLSLGRFGQLISNVIKTADQWKRAKPTDYEIDKSSICNFRPFPTNEYTIRDICSSSLSCSTKKYLYPNLCEKRACSPIQKWLSYEQKLEPACSTFHECVVEKALPMMAGVFFYQIEEMIFQRICPDKCNGPCNYAKTFQMMMEDSERLIMYAETLPSYWASIWRPFFNKALNEQAYTNIEKANSLIEQKKAQDKDMEHAAKQCSVIQHRKPCSIVELLEHHAMLKTFVENKHPYIKDIREQSVIDLPQMMHLQKDNLQHIELYGGIKRLDDNLQASVKGISKFLGGLAKFDKGIASADQEFISGKLANFKSSLKTVETKLAGDIKEGMRHMIGILAANLAEEIAQMVVLVATNSNPLKIIFSSPDLSDIIEQAQKIADATSQVVKGSKLMIAFGDLVRDSPNIAKAFGENTKQIKSIISIVKTIRNKNSKDIDADIDTFIREYGAYTPKQERHLLEKNNALWSAFKGAMCDVLNGQVGVGGAISKSITGAKLLCERLEGTLAQFFTLREDIYNFQFQLIDSIAAVVRGNIAQRFARNIKGTHDRLDAVQFLIGFYISQGKLQKVCSVYCDVLEYKNLGKSVSPCKKTGRLYSKANVDGLIAYADNTPYDEVQRTVYLPTRATLNDEASVINLQDLANEREVTIKIPADRAWLEKYGWISPHDTAIPFVKSLKLFLPQKNFIKWNQRYTSTHITVKSVSKSLVSLDQKKPVYLLPQRTMSFRTIYEEGYFACSNEIKNPYSLCVKLPKMCDKTTRVTPGNTLLPTILSIWSITAKSYEGSKKVKYDAPNPETNLLLSAKAILKMPTRMKKKRDNVPRASLSSVQSRKKRNPPILWRTNGCCPGNRYRVSLYNSTCKACPKDTTAVLGGLFCQINKAA